jgi:hypothetical protein
MMTKKITKPLTRVSFTINCPLGLENNFKKNYKDFLYSNSSEKPEYIYINFLYHNTRIFYTPAIVHPSKKFKTVAILGKPYTQAVCILYYKNQAGLLNKLQKLSFYRENTPVDNITGKLCTVDASPTKHSSRDPIKDDDSVATVLDDLYKDLRDDIYGGSNRHKYIYCFTDVNKNGVILDTHFEAFSLIDFKIVEIETGKKACDEGKAVLSELIEREYLLSGVAGKVGLTLTDDKEATVFWNEAFKDQDLMDFLLSW